MRERLNILIMPTWFPTESDRTKGVFIYQHASALANKNNVTILFAENGEINKKGLLEVVSDKNERGIRTIRFKYKKIKIPKITFFIYVLTYILIFKKIHKEISIDIIHSHTYTSAFIGNLLSKIFKTKHVCTEHSSQFITKRGLGKIESFKAKFSLNRVDALIAVSKTLKKYMEDFGIKKPISIIPNPIDTRFFVPPSPSAKKKMNKGTRILFVGHLTKNKGVLDLVDAASSIIKGGENITLDIIGDGPERESVEKKISEGMLGARVRIHGKKEKRELLKFYQECDFFVQPSYYETFGIVYLEAMSCGKPVIGYEIPALSEIVNPNNGIVVPVGNIEKLEQAILILIKNINKYNTEKISENINNNYSYYMVSKKVNNLYSRLISQ